MRPLEVAIIVVLLPYVLHLLSPSRGESHWYGVFALVAVIVTLGHWVVEGYRWQMIPAYCVAIILFIYECSRWFVAWRASYVLGGVALLGELLAIALSTKMPVFKLAAPTGPYKVGSHIRHLVDDNRVDPYSSQPDRPRELMVQLWYPADATAKGQFVPYRDKRTTTFRDAHYALVESHSLFGVPLSRSQARYPVVLFMPSWSGTRTESTYHTQQLASHGYIVVGIDHPYSSSITVFPDGRIARRRFSGEEDYSSETGFESFLKTADEQVRLRAYDARSVLDALERLNASDPDGILTERLDLGRIGVFGFSLGGGAAAQACWLDQRFSAGLDMDGMIAGESAKQGTIAPFFFMIGNTESFTHVDLSKADPATQREAKFNLNQIALMQDSLRTYGGYWMEIPTMGHGDFSDSPFYSVSRNGYAERLRWMQLTSRYVVAFFDEQLKGLKQKLLEGSSMEIPEVRFQTWKAKVSTTP
jgi:predicted dienelactone hydrolase